jgi:hypothetical protein
MKTKDRFLEREKLSEIALENCKLRKNFADIAMYLAEIERLYLELYQEYQLIHLTSKRKGVKINKKKICSKKT